MQRPSLPDESRKEQNALVYYRKSTVDEGCIVVPLLHVTGIAVSLLLSRSRMERNVICNKKTKTKSLDFLAELVFPCFLSHDLGTIVHQTLYDSGVEPPAALPRYYRTPFL